jgi:AraC-like DNA-binding protein
MSGDVLSDMLRAVRLRGAVYYYIEGREPWAAEAPASREMIPTIMPGVEHLMEFHGVAQGTCWAAIVGEAPVRMEQGDLILFPQGDAHVMSSAPGLRVAGESGPFFSPRPPQLPYCLSADEQGVTTARLDGGGHQRATVICGFLGWDAHPFNPLLASLPRILHLRAAAAGDSWVALFLRAAVDETNRRRPGGEAVLERMSEMMFVDLLRRHLDALAPEQTGWLAGMRDPGVGRALTLMHGNPGARWTLEKLGEEAGLSRSVLHERFVHLIGQPPMQYLTQWRMQLASARLRDSESKVLEIALDVGYDSEAAFSRAFRRVVGVTPSGWRRARRARQASENPLVR